MILAYNGEDYLSDAVRSTLSQPCDDLEVLILNDGSTDRSLEIANDWARKDSRVQVHAHDNVGMGANRNSGIPRMRGRWFLSLMMTMS